MRVIWKERLNALNNLRSNGPKVISFRVISLLVSFCNFNLPLGSNPKTMFWLHIKRVEHGLTQNQLLESSNKIEFTLPHPKLLDCDWFVVVYLRRCSCCIISNTFVLTHNNFSIIYFPSQLRNERSERDRFELSEMRYQTRKPWSPPLPRAFLSTKLK